MSENGPLTWLDMIEAVVFGGLLVAWWHEWKPNRRPYKGHFPPFGAKNATRQTLTKTLTES